MILPTETRPIWLDASLWHYLVSIHLLVQFTANVHLCFDWIKMKSSRAKLVPNSPLARYCSQCKFNHFRVDGKFASRFSYLLRVSVTHSHSNNVQQSLFLAIIIFSLVFVYPISSSAEHEPRQHVTCIYIYLYYHFTNRFPAFTIVSYLVMSFFSIVSFIFYFRQYRIAFRVVHNYEAIFN